MMKRFLHLRYLILLALATSMLACTETNQLTTQEKTLLVTEQDFTDFDISKSKRPKGKFHKMHTYLDQVTSLEYEYDVNESIYLLNTVDISRKASDAKINAYAMRTGALIGIKIGDISNKEIPLKNQYGGEAKLLLLRSGKEPVGNIFTYVHENKVWFLLCTGFYYDNAKDFEAIFAPHIEKIQAFSKLDS